MIVRNADVADEEYVRNYLRTFIMSLYGYNGDRMHLEIPIAFAEIRTTDTDSRQWPRKLLRCRRW